jgi:predicted permease
MSLFDRWRTRRTAGRDLAEEIQQHLDEKIEELMAGGLSRPDAASAARRAFGNVTLLTERGRDVWRWKVAGDLWSDAGYAMRQMKRSPGFAVTAILTLALGIGANAAVFSVVDAVVLHPLPFAEPDRLVSVLSRDSRGTPHPTVVSYPTFLEFRRANRVFERLVSYHDDDFTLTSGGLPVRVPGQIVSWDLFPLLHVQPQLGRAFVPADELPGARVVVLSHGLWSGRFNRDPVIAGKTIVLDGTPYTVVGVAPRGFTFPIQSGQVQLWTTMAQDASATTDAQPLTEQRGAKVLDLIGRLKPDASVMQAQGEMDRIAARLAVEHPDQNRAIAGTYVRLEQERLIGDTRQALAVLFGAVGLVLLIACANIANLLLARTTERAREFALRLAIGASRTRVVRQLLTENLVLALAGSASGILVAVAAVNLVRPFASEAMPRLHDVSVDGRVVAFSVFLALVTTFLFSLPTALRMLRVDAGAALTHQGRSATDPHDRLRGALVVVQIALGLVLASGASLLLAGVLHLMRQDLGFSPDGVLSFDVSLPDGQYEERKQIEFVTHLLERVGALPGVAAAAAGSPLPLTGRQMGMSFNIQERPSAPSERPSANLAIVTPGYFRTIGTPLVRGRDFTSRDAEDAPPVLIVNQAFAARFFPGDDAVGKQIAPGATSRGYGVRMREIVGVVGNARQSAVGAGDDPIYYFPYRQLPWFPPSVVVRTTVPAAVLEPTLRETVASMDRLVPVAHVRTMADRLWTGIAAARFQLFLLATFAVLAVTLTAIGLYGVLAYAVLRRTREIGVRMALGATAGSIAGLVLMRAMTLVAAGVGLGLGGAFLGNTLLRRMLQGVGPQDPILLATASVVVVLTALAAAYLPMRRAARIDPRAALAID